MPNYLKELKLFIKYFFFSFIFSLIVFFQKFSSIFIFFYYPISKIIKKKLLVLNTLDLINISFFLGLAITFLLSTIIFLLLSKLFFSNSWYNEQLNVFKIFFTRLFFLIPFLNILFFFIYKFIFIFSLCWSFEVFNSFSLFEIQLQIIDFLKFQIYSLYIIHSILIFITLIYLILKSFLTWQVIFFNFKTKKKIFLMFILCFYALILPEINFILGFGVISVFILEVIFFYICLKQKKLKLKCQQ